MRTIALDVGSKLIGLATSDPSGTIATPLKVIKRQGIQKDALTIVELCKQHQCTTIVVGLPLELDGTMGNRARTVMRLTKKLQKVFTGKVLTWDERFSTSSANYSLIASNVRRKTRKKLVDKVAAAIILQNYLDASK
ncbi:MAG: Holliday junction resolvase RuvX [Myxococcota bacterium]